MQCTEITLSPVYTKFPDKSYLNQFRDTLILKIWKMFIYQKMRANRS